MAETGDGKYEPETKSWAVRTTFPEDAWNAWGVMTTGSGGYYASSEMVAEWPDVTPPADQEI
jgi:hypothetical protein